ncbi:hypothetical protein GQ457_03G012530 [Hibiscus cannabinus]
MTWQLVKIDDDTCHLVGRRKNGSRKVVPFRRLELATRWKESKEHGIATRPSPLYFHEVHYVLYVLYNDKASLLSDVVSYINDLKAKIEELESQLQRECKKVKVEMVDNTMDNQSTTTTSEEQAARPSDSSSGTGAGTGGSGGVELDVKIMGNDAMIRVQSENVNYPSARLMGAVHDLEFQLHHASMSCNKENLTSDQLKMVVATRIAHVRRHCRMEISSTIHILSCA